MFETTVTSSMPYLWSSEEALAFIQSNTVVFTLCIATFLAFVYVYFLRTRPTEFQRAHDRVMKLFKAIKASPELKSSYSNALESLNSMIPGATVDPADSFTRFTCALNTMEIVYFHVPVLQFKDITSLERRQGNNEQDITNAILSALGEASIINAASLSTLTTNILNIADGNGKPTAEYVALPFLRSKDPDFLFNGNSPLLYIRSQYVSLYELLINTSTVEGPDKRNKFILDGNSGVGKTCFIYYFMYRLYKDRSSFRGLNCGRQNTDHSARVVASDPTLLGLSTYVDWVILDSVEGGTIPYPLSSCILYVNSNHLKVSDPEVEFKIQECCYCALPPWSYADTCAVGLCPLVVDANNFSVLHPLSVMANFIAHRSTPRELLGEANISLSYVFPRVPVSPSSDLLFFRALSEERQTALRESSTIPTCCFQSQFDQSREQVEESRYLRPVVHITADRGMTPRQAFVSDTVNSEDLQKLIYLSSPNVSFRHEQAPFMPDTQLALQGFKGVALEMALALKVDQENEAFHRLFSLLLPIFSASVMPLIYNSFHTLDPSENTNMMDSITIAFKKTGIFTFREHFIIVAPNSTADIMPQHISIVDRPCRPSHLFSYVIRSTSIMFMVDHFLRTAQEALRNTLLNIFHSVTGSSGVGFCFEYFSLRGIGQEIQPISVYSLPRADDTAATQMTVSRTQLRYFYHENQVMTFDPNTLYLPVHSNYAGVDAIGSATIGGHGYLVFYQATIKPKHPVFKNQQARDNWETSRANQVVTYWRNLAQGAEINDAIIVFITCNDQFTEVQNDYVNLQLPTQYVYMKDANAHLA